jgi:hypothetical protein
MLKVIIVLQVVVGDVLYGFGAGFLRDSHHYAKARPGDYAR